VTLAATDVRERRWLDTRLARYTAGFVAIYAPIETWVSWPHVGSLFFLVDAIALVLMVIGLVLNRRGRWPVDVTVLAAAFGWMGGNVWRGMAMRLEQPYDSRLWPEGRMIETTGPLAVALGGAVLVVLSAIGLGLAIAAARRRPTSD
jgi:hypothetical protein